MDSPSVTTRRGIRPPGYCYPKDYHSKDYHPRNYHHKDYHLDKHAMVFVFGAENKEYIRRMVQIHAVAWTRM